MAGQLIMRQDQIDDAPAEWHALRRRGVTASEIAAVLGIAPANWGSAYKLYVAKTTGGLDGGDRDELRRGRVLEPYVADVFMESHPWLNVFPGGLYASGQRPWQMATFDRLAIDPAVYGLVSVGSEPTTTMLQHAMPVQIKTTATADGWGDDGTDSIPAHYRAQALYEMDVQDADTVLVPCLFMQQWAVRTYVIERGADEQEDIELMREAAGVFIDRLRREDPPPIDWTPATTEALKTIHPVTSDRAADIGPGLARRYRAAQRASEQATQRLGLVTNLIRAKMGDARVAVWDDEGRAVKVVTRSQFTRHAIDTKRLRREQPGTAKQYETETPTEALYPSKWSRGGK
jgi:putative phage-type endonuclease